MTSYCQQYYEITWEPILTNLAHYVDDMTISSAPKRHSALKDRFKAFNKAFGDIRDTQCQWIIPDDKMKLTVTKKITSTLIPSYRKFFKEMEAANFTKNPEKYFKSVLIDPAVLLTSTKGLECCSVSVMLLSCYCQC